MITSAGNSRVKHVIQLNTKAKLRKEEGLFVAEGRKMFSEAPRGWIREVYVSESAAGDPELAEALAEIPHDVVSESVFRKMCDTKTPQGVLTVLERPDWKRGSLTGGQSPLLAVLEDLQDPGNVGTIFRTAEAAGADGIILSRGCADLFNPKTVRSTMGSIYRMPFAYVDDMAALMEELKERGVRTFAAHLNGQSDYDREAYIGGCAFLIGNEGNGLSDALSARADRLIRIPMAGEVESLNAAMATGILLYEAARQRRNS